MFKKLMFFSLAVIIISVSGMEKDSVVANIIPWVKAADHINVESMKMSQSIPIQDTTTILDIKNILENNEGVPVAQQKLLARWTERWIVTKHSKALANTDIVKEVMSTYNTDRLALFLTLRPQTTDN